VTAVTGTIPDRPDTCPASPVGSFAGVPPAHPAPRRKARERTALVAIGAYAITLFVFPSDLVLRVVGGQGFVSGLVALGLFGLWATSTLLGQHDPRVVRHPTRAVLAHLLVMSLLAWSFTPFHGLTATQQLSADRWIMLVVASAGVVLVAAEGLSSLRALMAVCRLTVLGAAFCSLVAVLQWVLTFDLAGVIRQSLPGFTVNSDYSVYQPRGALERVTGTALHPIELGVVAGLVLPLAVVVAQHDRSRGLLRRWTPVALIALAIPASVSRSAVLAIGISVVVLVVGMPARTRLTALAAVPVSGMLVSLARPGFLRTLGEFIGAGSSDTSVATRLQDYPMVVRLVAQHPWLGNGGGTFMPANALDILDNQYLKAAVEFGLVGMTGVLAWLVVPFFVALSARARSRDPVLRSVAAALAGAAAAGAVASATFDSLSFNMFAGLESLVTGCIGACWVLSGRESRTDRRPLPPLET
jgi:O-antigen ligase